MTMKGFSTAGCALAVLLACLLAQEAECGTEFILGGDIGWTNTADIDYNSWLSDYKIKVGDTLTFANYDNVDHSVVHVDKLAYDTCGQQGNELDAITISPNIVNKITYYESQMDYIICTVKSHCIQGMKVAVQVLNADGTMNTETETTADPPKANSAFAMPGLSWTSQLLIATVAVVVVAIPVLL